MIIMKPDTAKSGLTQQYKSHRGSYCSQLQMFVKPVATENSIWPVNLEKQPKILLDTNK